ncbi:hypothetical protein BWQ96_06561 [Gracilariopsis chorda]|uniref:HAT C-terminal dimerisation domain-containing protein n=1 Tax=Gracilariopsis chorda TaxID=448386 RepID=A0A2V3INJ8_9FLOR|nr:hypothetical protein BWQ96_06561 [Gracilariopsis chorda]|eukprot:PXF43656.1 hypothetical protein BWQ96_06561 [Gracilariopsis chorda]
MLARILKVQPVLTYIPFVLVNERTACGIDPEFELPPALTSLISSPAFWTRVREVHDVSHPIATFIDLLESNSATMAGAYASFVAMLLTMRASSFLNAAQKQMLESSLYRRWDLVYNPVQPLAFHCDPNYNDSRTHISLHFGTSSLELNKRAVTEQCNSALETLARDECHFQSLLGEYSDLSVNPCALLTRLKQFQPRYIWVQIRERLPHLAAASEKAYRALASTAAVERNHIIGKRVLSAKRCRKSDLLLERQVAVAQNSLVLRRTLTHKRMEAFDKLMLSVLELNWEQGEAISDEPETVAVEDDGWDNEQVLTEISLSQIVTLDVMPNSVVFDSSE